MAKTIEERAKKWGKDYPKLPLSELPYTDNDIEVVAENSFLQGAAIQKKLIKKQLTEKACEIYRKELSDIIGIFNRLGKDLYNINELGELLSLDGSLKDFRKALEEELCQI